MRPARDVTVNIVVTEVEPARVVVDPNAVSRVHPGKTVADTRESSRPVRRGEYVIAVQPDEYEADFVGHAIVADVDDLHGLIYLDVDWSSFHDEMPPEADAALAMSSGSTAGTQVHYLDPVRGDSWSPVRQVAISA
jgi:hypothetical protein